MVVRTFTSELLGKLIFVVKMEKSSDDKTEKDSVPIEDSEDDKKLVEVATVENEVVEYRGVNGNVSHASSSSSLVFTGCRDFTVGSVFHIGGAVARPGCSRPGPDQRLNVQRTESDIYRKTPTIKAMLESTERIPDLFLNQLSENFGDRWRELLVTVLHVDELFIGRMKEDHFGSSGTSEVRQTEATNS